MIPKACVSDQEVAQLILETGRLTRPNFTLNAMKGVPGAFYRDERAKDAMGLVKLLIEEKRKLEQGDSLWEK